MSEFDARLGDVKRLPGRGRLVGILLLVVLIPLVVFGGLTVIRNREAASFRAGLQAAEAGRWAEAEAAFSRAINLRPPEILLFHLEARAERAYARFWLDDLAGAREDFDYVQLRQGDQLEFLPYLAIAAFREGDDPRGQQLSDLMLDENVFIPETLRGELFEQRAHFALEQGRWYQALVEAERAAAHDDALALPYALRARQLFRDHDWPAALVAADRAIERDAELADPHALRGAILTWEYELQEAGAALEQALLLDPANLDALVMRSYLHLLQQQPGEAKSRLETAVSVDPEAPVVLWGQALLQRFAYDFDGARALVNRAIARQDDRPEFYWLRATTYRRTAQETAIREDLERALALHADFPPALASLAGLDLLQYRLDAIPGYAARLSALASESGIGPLVLSSLFERQGDWEQALEEAERALEINPEHPPAYVQLGNLHLIMGRDGTAVVNFNRALEIDPTQLAARFGLARFHFSNDQYEKGMDYLDAILSLDSGSQWVYNSKALAELARGDLDQAWSYLDQALGLDPDAPAILLTRSILETADGNINDALSTVSRALDRYPEYPDGFAARGRVLFSAGDYAGARQAAGEALDRDPRQVSAHMTNALVADATETWPSVIRSTDNALAIDPELALALALRGRAYYFLARYEKARDDLQAALELDPDLVQAYQDLALVLAEEGDEQQAIGLLEQALELAGSLEVISQIENQLAFLRSIPPLVAGRRVVGDRDDGFRFTYPDTWTFQPPELANTRVLINPPGTEDATLAVFALPNPGDRTPAEVLEIAETGLDFVPNYESLDLAEVTLGGQPGLIRTFNAIDPQLALRNLRGKFYVAVGRDVALIFVFVADLRNYREFVGEVDAIVDTLVFLS